MVGQHGSDFVDLWPLQGPGGMCPSSLWNGLWMLLLVMILEVESFGKPSSKLKHSLEISNFRDTRENKTHAVPR